MCAKPITIYLSREEKCDVTILSFIEISKYRFSFAHNCNGNVTIRSRMQTKLFTIKHHSITSSPVNVAHCAALMVHKPRINLFHVKLKLYWSWTLISIPDGIWYVVVFLIFTDTIPCYHHRHHPHTRFAAVLAACARYAPSSCPAARRDVSWALGFG